MGVILFYLHYVVAAVLLYHILRCIYVKQPVEYKYSSTTYEITDHDKRLKYPLWFIIVLGIIFITPIINVFGLGAYLIFKVTNTDGSKYNKYYCKSSLTKKY